MELSISSHAGKSGQGVTQSGLEQKHSCQQKNPFVNVMTLGLRFCPALTVFLKFE